MSPAHKAGVLTPANDSPSLWKAATDHSRLIDAEHETDLLRGHVIRRAKAFAWAVPTNDNQAWPLLQ